MSALVASAREFAHLIFMGADSRLRHTTSVARAAADVSRTVAPGDVELLLAAAWLHDVGYAPGAKDTDFHPLDGARFLERDGWPQRVCGLVAFHSGAIFVANHLGLGRELRHFREEPGALGDALTYADQTSGPNGERMTLEQRLEDKLRRHGPDSPSGRVHAERAQAIRDAALRVERRLAARSPVRIVGAHRRRYDDVPGRRTEQLD